MALGPSGVSDPTHDELDWLVKGTASLIMNMSSAVRIYLLLVVLSSDPMGTQIT